MKEKTEEEIKELIKEYGAPDYVQEIICDFLFDSGHIYTIYNIIEIETIKELKNERNRKHSHHLL